MTELPARRPGPSVRSRLALSYAGFLLLAGGLLLAVVWVFLLRYVPDTTIATRGGFVPNRSDLVRAFGPAAAAAVGFLLVFGLVGGWFLAGRMLAPLERIGQAARAAADGSLSHRLRLPGRQDEFREVADAFDHMLERLEDHVGQQRRFAANASHELRTPLATTQAMLEVARASPSTADPELLERLQTVNSRAIDMTEALLLLSRAETRSFDPEPVDLSLLAEEAVEMLLGTAERRGVGVEVDGGEAWTLGSPALLSRLAANLIENAIVHNLGADGTVVVRTGAFRGGCRLEVESTGAPISSERARTLVEPFRRGADRRREPQGDHVGAGLGLAIAHSIVTAHAGTLDLAPRDGGGLVVTVLLPGRSPLPVAHRAGTEPGSTR